MDELYEKVKDARNVEEMKWLITCYFAKVEYESALDLMRDKGTIILFAQEGAMGEFYLLFSIVLWYFGRLEDSMDYANMALEVARSSGNRKLEARALLRMVVINDNQGNYGVCFEMGKQAMKLAWELKEIQIYVYCCYNVGYAHQVVGDLEKATALYFRGFELLKDHPNERLRAALLRNLSKVRFDEGLVDQARQLIQEAISIQKDLPYTVYWELAHSYQRMVEYASHEGNIELADKFIRELDELLSDLDNIRLMHIAWHAKGLYFKGLYLQREDEKSLRTAMSFFKRLIYGVKVRQELRLASFCHFLQLAVGNGEGQLDREIRELLLLAKEDTEKEAHKTFSLSLKEIESKFYATRGEISTAISIIEDGKEMAFENQIHRKLMDLFKLEKEIKPLADEEEGMVREKVGLSEEIWGNVTPDLYKYRFIFNPVRLSIIKWLMRHSRMTTVELKAHLGLSWGVLNTHLEALRKKGYVEINPTINEEGVGTAVYLRPEVSREFNRVISLLKVFIGSINQI